MSTELPWYRYPIVWLVIAIPLLTVPAGLVTVWVASRDADTVVADDFRVDGLAVNRDSVRDAAASRLDVHAAVAADGSTVTVTLREGHATLPGRLVLRLWHATRSTADQEVRLDRSGERAFTATLEPLAPGHWFVELAPPDRGWRLTGEFREPLGQLELAPHRSP